jgi:hypothetical protein
LQCNVKLATRYSVSTMCINPVCRRDRESAGSQDGTFQASGPEQAECAARHKAHGRYRASSTVSYVDRTFLPAMQMHLRPPVCLIQKPSAAMICVHRMRSSHGSPHSGANSSHGSPHSGINSLLPKLGPNSGNLGKEHLTGHVLCHKVPEVSSTGV